ncbi:MAG: hypothetical protein LUE98_08520 [Tannerellaceae bacterium]|nr:hypothetical protein [Tannerellaceae bacterium]
MGLTPVLVVGIIFLSIYKIFELFVRRQERIALIEKLSENMDLSNIQKQLSGMNHLRISGFGSLKSGCLLIGLGLGMLVAYIVVTKEGLSHSNWGDSSAIGIIYASCILLFGGASLLIAFIIEMKLSKKKED